MSALGTSNTVSCPLALNTGNRTASSGNNFMDLIMVRPNKVLQDNPIGYRLNTRKGHPLTDTLDPLKEQVTLIETVSEMSRIVRAEY